MTDKELEICERFKQIRKSLNMKQGDFANEIKTTQGHVSDIENKRKGVSDRVIEIICLKFDINEEWLRNGIGPMKRQPDDEFAECVSDMLSEDNPFYDLIKGILCTYHELDKNSKKVLIDSSEKLLDILKKKKEG